MTISALIRRCDTALVRTIFYGAGQEEAPSDRRARSFPMRTEGCDTSTGCFEVRWKMCGSQGVYVDGGVGDVASG